MTRPTHPSRYQCTGLASGATRPDNQSPAGLPALPFRLAESAGFLAEMLDRLSRTAPDGNLVQPGEGALAQLSQTPESNWSIALLEAWSDIGDVLTFYQERMLNEGFIGTATTSQARHYLQAMLGENLVRIRPASLNGIQHFNASGVAGSARILAQVHGRAGAPQSLSLAKNTMVRRFSPAGGPVQHFVTQARTEVRSDWTDMKPVVKAEAEKATSDYRVCGGEAFQSHASVLKPGVQILISNAAENIEHYQLQQVEAARQSSNKRETVLDWRLLAQADSQAAPQEAGFKMPRFHKLSQPLEIFGAKAPDLTDQPPQVRRAFVEAGGAQGFRAQPDPKTNWERVEINEGLTDAALEDWTCGPEGDLYAVGRQGVWRRRANDHRWQSDTVGVNGLHITSIAVSRDGARYIGASTGAVFKTAGGQTGWSRLTGSYVVPPGAFVDKMPLAMRTSLPPGPIQKLRLAEAGLSLDGSKRPDHSVSDQTLFAATVQGLFRNDQEGLGWLHVPLSEESHQASSLIGGQPQSPHAVKDVLTLYAFDECFLVVATLKDVRMIKLPPALPKHEKGLMRIGVGVAHALQSGAELAQKLFRSRGVHLPPPGVATSFPGDFMDFAVIKVEGSAFLVVRSTHGVFAYDAHAKAFAPLQDGWPDTDPCPGAMILPPVHAETSDAKEADAPSAWNEIALLAAASSGVFGFTANKQGHGDRETLSGQWRSLPGTEIPKPSDPKTAVRARITASSAGELFLYSTPILAKAWPGFELSPLQSTLNEVDVVGLTTPPEPGAKGVLIGDDPSDILVFTITGAICAHRIDFGLKSRTVRLTIEVISGQYSPERFGRRQSRICIAGSELFRAVQPHDLAHVLNGDLISLDGVIDDLKGRPLAVTARRRRARFLPVPGARPWRLDATGALPLGDARLPFQTIKRFLRTRGGLFALSKEGVWRTQDGKSFKADSTGLSQPVTKPLDLISHGSDLYLLTSDAIFRRVSSSGRWEAMATPSPASPLTCLAVVPAQTHPSQQSRPATMLAGAGSSDLYLSKDQGRTWTPVRSRAFTRAGGLVSLLATPEGFVIGAAADGTLYWSHDEFQVWRQIESASTLDPVSLLRTIGDRCVAATSSGHLHAIDLAPETPTMQPLSANLGDYPINDVAGAGLTWGLALKGGGAAFSTDGGKHWTRCDVGLCDDVSAIAKLGASWILGSDSDLNDRADVKTVSAPGAPGLLDHGLVTPHLAEALKRAEVKAPDDPVVNIIRQGQSWLLEPRKKGDAVWLVNGGESLYATSAPDDLLLTEFQAGPGQSSLAYTGRDGSSHAVRALSGEYQIRASKPSDTPIMQLSEIKDSRHDRGAGQTHIRLAAPLTAPLDPGDASCSANVIDLAQGLLIRDEVLQAVNTIDPHPRYPLKSGPLVFESAPDSAVPVLNVYVNGQSFERVDSFSGAKATDQIYMLSLNAKGFAEVVFGDGLTGLAITPGSDLVTASYRAGMEEFNPDDGARFLFDQAPFGLINMAQAAAQIAPTPALKPGRRQSSLTSLTQIPRQLISLDDYRQVARALPGVTKSHVILSRAKGQTCIRIFVIGDSPDAFGANEDSLQVLSASIAGLSAAPPLPIEVRPVLMSPIRLRAVLELSPHIKDATSADAVCIQAHQVLENQFGFEAAQIEASVRRSEIEIALARISGVNGVRLERLYREGQPPGISDINPTSLSQTGPNQDVSMAFLSSQAGAVELLAILSDRSSLVYRSGAAAQHLDLMGLKHA
jgi:hypothetical protein